MSEDRSITAAIEWLRAKALDTNGQALHAAVLLEELVKLNAPAPASSASRHEPPLPCEDTSVSGAVARLEAAIAGDGSGCAKDIRTLIAALPSETRWIPVTERLRPCARSALQDMARAQAAPYSSNVKPNTARTLN